MPEQPENLLYADLTQEKHCDLSLIHVGAEKLRLLLGWGHSLADNQQLGSQPLFLCFERQEVFMPELHSFRLWELSHVLND